MRIALALLTVVLLFAAPAEAQKLARKDTEVPTEGFKFRSLSGYDAVPPGGRDGAEVAKFVDGMRRIVQSWCAAHHQWYNGPLQVTGQLGER